MRISDSIRLALKNIRGIWAFLPILGAAIAAFCLCYAGTVYLAVDKEESQPYEIIASSKSALSDNDIAEILKAEDVTAVTAVLEVPVTIKTGKFSADLTLKGLDPNYIQETFLQGALYPKNSVMPYIILNEAALKKFSVGKDDDDDMTGDISDNDSTEDTAAPIPDVNWLGSSFTLQTGEDSKPVISKVCGIIADKEQAKNQEPAAYISLFSAKALLSRGGQSARYTTVNVRIRNIGCAESVSKSIASLGLNVTNSTEELQSGWDMETKEMTYLIVIGGFCIICSAVLLAAWKRISQTEQKETWKELRLLGMKTMDIKRLFMTQSAFISLIGILIGILVSLSLPSFLSTDPGDKSIFILTAPFSAVMFSIILCIIISILPMLNVKRMN